MTNLKVIADSVAQRYSGRYIGEYQVYNATASKSGETIWLDVVDFDLNMEDEEQEIVDELMSPDFIQLEDWDDAEEKAHELADQANSRFEREYLIGKKSYRRDIAGAYIEDCIGREELIEGFNYEVIWDSGYEGIKASRFMDAWKTP